MRKHSTRRLDSQRSEPRRPRTHRARMVRRASAVVVLLAAVISALTGAHFTETTEATWADAEYSRGNFTAGEVNRARSLSCTKPWFTSRLDFAWTNPTSGLSRSSYRWEFYNPGVLGLGTGSTTTGTLPATATAVQVPVSRFSAGTGHFRLYAVGPGGWEAGVQHTYTVTTGLLISCGSKSDLLR